VRVAGLRGVEQALGEPFTIAQVDEDEPAVVSTSEGPAHQRHRLSDVLAA
jgi:hypothetical protein